MSETERFVHESIQDKRSIQQFLLTLVDGIENGRVTLSAEKDMALLTPAELIRFSIKAKKKTGKSKLTLNLSWKETDVDTCRKKGKEIKVSS